MIEQPLHRSAFKPRSADPPEVTERYANIEGRLTPKLATLQARLHPRGQRLNEAAKEVVSRPLPARVKYSRLWKMADEVASLRQDLTACRSGCDHCCHIPVPIGRAEAELIASRIGKTPSAPDALPPAPVFGFNRNTPCTFLRHRKCSIYASRPLVCRNHANLDDDDLLCRLDTGPRDVPLLDAGIFRDLEISIAAEQGEIQIADIRQWFPA